MAIIKTHKIKLNSFEENLEKKSVDYSGSIYLEGLRFARRLELDDSLSGEDILSVSEEILDALDEITEYSLEGRGNKSIPTFEKVFYAESFKRNSAHITPFRTTTQRDLF